MAVEHEFEDAQVYNLRATIYQLSGNDNEALADRLKASRLGCENLTYILLLILNYIRSYLTHKCLSISTSTWTYSWNIFTFIKKGSKIV